VREERVLGLVLGLGLGLGVLTRLSGESCQVEVGLAEPTGQVGHDRRDAGGLARLRAAQLEQLGGPLLRGPGADPGLGDGVDQRVVVTP
jgi:hypothetical protein